jgi:tryptophanyl-tRNA synthetase
MKKQLAEDMVRFIKPIREKAAGIYRDKPYLKTVIEKGTERARISARNTIEQARDFLGLNYFG